MDLRERILASDDIPVEVIDVPEWGEKVELRGLTGLQRSELLQPVAGAERVELSVMYWRCVLLGAFDPDTGAPVFTESDQDAAMGKSGLAIDRIATKVMKLSGLSNENLGEGRGDSPKTPSGDSPSS